MCFTQADQQIVQVFNYIQVNFYLRKQKNLILNLKVQANYR